MKKTLSGFTLIELMITVTIIGIVAAIAYPSYQQYVIRTHRAEGKALLTQAMVDQQRFFTNNNTYALTTSNPNGLGYAADPAISENNYYSLSVDAPTAACPIATCVSMTVTAVGAQATDATCATMTQTSTGRKTATNTECWEK